MRSLHSLISHEFVHMKVTIEAMKAYGDWRYSFTHSYLGTRQVEWSAFAPTALDLGKAPPVPVK